MGDIHIFKVPAWSEFPGVPHHQPADWSLTVNETAGRTIVLAKDGKFLLAQNREVLPAGWMVTIIPPRHPTGSSLYVVDKGTALLHMQQPLNATPAPFTQRFEDQESLEEYVETELNQKGLDPTVALIDSAGVQTTAHCTAPGGDGYGFEFAVHDRDSDSGMIHCHECSECEHPCGTVGHGWMPKFPVWIFVAP